MKPLGGMEGMVCVEWLYKAHFYGLPCVSHLWMATQEQRDLRCQMLRSFKCSHLALWALPGSYRLQELSHMDSWW